MTPTTYRFGRFHLQPQTRQLLVDGQPARLGARAFDLLLALVERRERMVPRGELFQLVWPGRVVEDQNLKVQVVALRKLLGEAIIQTVPGRGYRFAAEVDDGGTTTIAPPPAPTPPPSAAAPTNLGAALGTLFGREGDLAALHGLLAGERLVTLCGAGGIGKTRLARRVARERFDHHPDGVWLVELAPLADGALVAATTARALGFAPTAERSSAEGLARSLAAFRLLIVLDNCEHLIDAAAALAEALLAHAPQVKLLATSQVALHLPGEQVYRLGALALPAPGDGADSAAVDLFVSRVRAADARFALTSAHHDAVVDICRHLDGLPLALELAAARVPTLGVQGVRERLGERLRLLTGGARGAPSRQQTLRDALQWSHALLGPDEQAVLRRLGVFAGSFGLGAAQQVCADAQIDAWAVLDHLAALVDKSLVLTEPGEPPRYRLLESTRALALEELQRCGELGLCRKAHAHATAGLMHQAYETQPKMAGLAWIAQWLCETDNLREAMAWSLGAQGDMRVAAELFSSAGAFWHLSGWIGEGVAHYRALQPRIDPAWPAELRARIALAVARLSAFYGIDPGEGARAAREAVGLLRESGNPQRLYTALYFLIPLAERVSSFDEIEPALAEMRALERPDWPPALRLQGRWAQARQLPRQGRSLEYRDAFVREVQLCSAMGDDRSAWLAAHSVALAELQLGRPNDAVQVLAGVAAQIRSRGMQRQFVYQIAMLATARIVAGDAQAAGADLHEAVALLRGEGALWWLGDSLGRVAARRGDFDAAARLQGWAMARTAERGDRRGPVMQAESERLAAELAPRLDAERLRTLQAEGALLDDAAVAALALGASPMEPPSRRVP